MEQLARRDRDDGVRAQRGGGLRSARALVRAGGGITEDPVCGSGNISVAVYLRHFERAPPAYVARQGMQLGRDGRVHMRIDASDIWLGGEAVACVDGKLAG